MGMPYNLQRLLPEALAVLRFLRTRDGASAEVLEAGTGLSNRVVGRAIRRLVNFDQIEMRDRVYRLTTDGKITAHQLAEYDATLTDQPEFAAAPESAAVPEADVTPIAAPAAAAPTAVIRHLTVVMQRAFPPNMPTPMFISVNAAQPGGPQLSTAAHVELQISAVGGTLSAFRADLEVPPVKAAAPAQILLTPAESGASVRVRIDAMQIVEGHKEPLGGMYFDVKVPPDDATLETSMRAVGMDFGLRG